MKEIVIFFRNFRIFANLRATYIEKVFKSMKILQFKRGHKVYTEGSSSIDGIYFIIAGDFEVTRQVKTDIKPEMGRKQAQRALCRQAVIL